MSQLRLRVASTQPDVEVLGPGSRYVLWVQGCPLDCRSCVSQEWISETGGTWRQLPELADDITARAADGLTISGGEPMAQAEAVHRLIQLIRRQRDLSVMCYSGYTIEHLRRHGTAAQQELLSALDILVDGPFLAGKLTSLRWRGSANQRVHLLTQRHRDLAAQPDDSAGLQFVVDQAETIRWVGVPNVSGFRETFERAAGLTPIEEEACQ
jgi:anaerobic ribonucleoside-triphosphate reductase activating protein